MNARGIGWAMGLAGTLGCAAGTAEPSGQLGAPSPAHSAGSDPAPKEPEGSAADWVYRGVGVDYALFLLPTGSITVRSATGTDEVRLAPAASFAGLAAVGRPLEIEIETDEAGCERMRLTDGHSIDPDVEEGVYLQDPASGQEQQCAAAPGCGPQAYDCGDGICVEEPSACGSGAPPCDVGEFVCPDDSCVGVGEVCDGFPGCEGGEDEVGCKPPASPCAPGQAQCANGACVASLADCPSGPDPSPDPMTPGTSCPDEEYGCPDGSCIPATYECDGVVDCESGADEAGSAQCIGGGNVPCAALCDGVADCFDASDELYCG